MIEYRDEKALPPEALEKLFLSIGWESASTPPKSFTSGTASKKSRTHRPCISSRRGDDRAFLPLKSVKIGENVSKIGAYRAEIGQK